MLHRLLLVSLAFVGRAPWAHAVLRGRILQQSFPDYDFSNVLVDDTQVVSASGNYVLSLEISDTGGLEASGQFVDYLQVYYTVDTNPQVLWLDFTGDNYQTNPQVAVSPTSQVSVRVVGKTTCTCETYFLRNFVLSGPPGPPSPPPPCAIPWSATTSYTFGPSGLEFTEILSTDCVNSVTLSLDISHTGGADGLEGSGFAKDTLQAFYKVDNGAEQTWFDYAGDAYVSSPSLSVNAGSQITLRIKGKTSATGETYLITNLAVNSGSLPQAPPTPMPIPNPTKAPTPMPVLNPVATPFPTLNPTPPPTPTGNCGPVNENYSYVISSTLFQATETIDTSCAADVNLSLLMSDAGDGLESSGPYVDFVQVFYQVDGGTEITWIDILGANYQAAQSVTIATGNQLRLRITGKTSCSCETYQLSNFVVQPAISPTPAPIVGPTTPAPTNPPAPTSGSAAVISGELRKWHKITLSYTGPSASEVDAYNPFLNYRMEVTFSKGSKSYTVPGYFAADGNAGETGAASGNQWVCHFAPDETGVWQYVASFVTGTNVAIETGGTPTSFDGDIGSFTVAATDKTDVDHRGKGRLNYVGKHHLQFAESGDYFLKVGPDSPENFLAYGDFDNSLNQKDWAPHIGDWQTGDPTWGSGTKGKGMIGALNYLSSKGANSFSFLTMNIQGDDGNVFPYVGPNELTDDFVRMDVSKLAQWEIVFEHADKKGLFMHFKTQETENDQLLDGGALGTQRKVYYRELVARFSHHLALNWNLGEEITNTIAEVKEFSDYFKLIDPYDHPVVLHTGLGGYNYYYTPMLGYSTFDGASLQLDPSIVFSETLKWVQNSAASSPSRPWIVCNDEQAPSSDGVLPDADAILTGNQDMIRKDVLWGNLMAGGAGVEYYFGYAYDCTDLSCQDYRTRDNMWTVSTYTLNFFRTHVPFWSMSNEDAVRVPLESSDWVLANTDVLLVYRKDDLNSSGTINMSGLSGSYSVQWFNPRTGGGLQTSNIQQVTAGGVVSYGIPPSEGDLDWAILVKKV